MPRKLTIPPITNAQAKYILEKLIDEGVVNAGDVRRLISVMWSEMSAIEKRIAELRAVAEPLRQPARAMRKGARTVRRASRKILTPERRESMRLQGRYLGSLMKIRKGDRARFRKIAKERGRAAAIQAMDALNN